MKKLFLAISLFGLVLFVSASPTHANTECGTWEEISHPFGNGTISLEVHSETDIYALVFLRNKPPVRDVVTIWHWDGAAWTTLTSYTTYHSFSSWSYPSEMLAFAPDNLWLFTYDHADPGSSYNVQHWDGKTWTAPGFLMTSLYAVAASSPSDIWVVGYNYRGPLSSSVVSHWNGERWKDVVRKIFKDITPFGVLTFGPKDVWVVGAQTRSDSYGTVALHRGSDGWAKIHTLTPKPVDHAALYSLSAVSSRNIWAVGSRGTDTNFTSLIERWNGKQWKLMPQPASAVVSNIVPTSTKSVWANTDLGLAYWNGVEWSMTDANGIHIVSSPPGSTAWGTSYDRDKNEGHIFKYAGTLPPCPAQAQ